MSENEKKKYQCIECDTVMDELLDSCPGCSKGNELFIDENHQFFMEQDEMDDFHNKFTLLPWESECSFPTEGDIALWNRRATGTMTVNDLLNEDYKYI